MHLLLPARADNPRVFLWTRSSRLYFVAWPYTVKTKWAELDSELSSDRDFISSGGSGSGASKTAVSLSITAPCGAKPLLPAFKTAEGGPGMLNAMTKGISKERWQAMRHLTYFRCFTGKAIVL